MIIMDSKTQLTVDVITKVSEGKITINNAAKLLAYNVASCYLYKKKNQLVHFSMKRSGRVIYSITPFLRDTNFL